MKADAANNSNSFAPCPIASATRKWAKWLLGDSLLILYASLELKEGHFGGVGTVLLPRVHFCNVSPPISEITTGLHAGIARAPRISRKFENVYSFIWSARTRNISEKPAVFVFLRQKCQALKYWIFNQKISSWRAMNASCSFSSADSLRFLPAKHQHDIIPSRQKSIPWWFSPAWKIVYDRPRNWDAKSGGSENEHCSLPPKAKSVFQLRLMPIMDTFFTRRVGFKNYSVGARLMEKLGGKKWEKEF